MFFEALILLFKKSYYFCLKMLIFCQKMLTSAIDHLKYNIIYPKYTMPYNLTLPTAFLVKHQKTIDTNEYL